MQTQVKLMSISITCTSCDTQLKAPEKASGRSIPCPKCKAVLTVPHIIMAKAVVAPNPPTHNNPANSESTTLTPCRTCQRQIAATAHSCPGCGAPNGWIHPDVDRFLKNLDKIKLPASFKHDSTKTGVHGTAKILTPGPASQWFLIAGGLGILLIVISLALSNYLGVNMRSTSTSTFFSLSNGSTLTFTGGLILIVLAAALRNAAFQQRWFKIDLSMTPPTWESNDDEFWKPIREFFLKSGKVSTEDVNPRT